jgi:hypothetical protein
MRSILVILAFLSLLAADSPTRAEVSFILENAGGCGAASAYVGPADVTPTLGITEFWGARAVSCAYAVAGGAGMIIQRASDNTTATIDFVPSGNLDVTTAAAFCAATTCGVQSLVEQAAGGLSFAAASQATEPQLVFSWYGPKPSVHFIAANSTQLNNTGYFLNQPGNISVVVNTVSVPTTGALVAFTGAIGQSWSTNMLTSGPTPDVQAGANLLGGVATNGTTHSLQFVINSVSGTSSVTVDGSTTTGNAGTESTFGGTAYLGTDISGGDFLNGYMPEVVLSVGGQPAWSSTQISALHANQSTYWGTP